MIDDDLAPLLFRLAGIADDLTLPVWEIGQMKVETKADGSPVTSTDVAVETALRAALAEIFPEDGFCGEEVGDTPSQSGRTWIVDGIDGTRAFTNERAEWSTLIALVKDDVPIAGIVTSPALERRWYSRQDGHAFVVPSNGVAEQLSVSSSSTLTDAQLARWPWTSPVKPAFRQHADRLARIVARRGGTIRPSVDSRVPGGAMLVADGRLDAFVMFGGQPWDHAAPSAVVTAAGGRFSCLAGSSSLATGAGVYSNGAVHDELLARLRPPG